MREGKAAGKENIPLFQFASFEAAARSLLLRS